MSSDRDVSSVFGCLVCVSAIY